MNNLPELLTEAQVSEILGKTIKTLRNWRYIRKGPAWTKLGGSVRYPSSELAEYIESQTMRPR